MTKGMKTFNLTRSPLHFCYPRVVENFQNDFEHPKWNQPDQDSSYVDRDLKDMDGIAQSQWMYVRMLINRPRVTENFVKVRVRQLPYFWISKILVVNILIFYFVEKFLHEYNFIIIVGYIIPTLWNDRSIFI